MGTDVHHIAEECGIRLLDRKAHSAGTRGPGDCFCPRTLRRILENHGEEHLRTVLEMIVAGEENAGELHADTIWAVSDVLLAGKISPRELAERLDRIDLGELRVWSQVVRGDATTSATMAAVLLWQLAPPAPPTAEEIAAEERKAAMRKRRVYRKRLESQLGESYDDRMALPALKQELDEIAAAFPQPSVRPMPVPANSNDTPLDKVERAAKALEDATRLWRPRVLAWLELLRKRMGTISANARAGDAASKEAVAHLVNVIIPGVLGLLEEARESFEDDSVVQEMSASLESLANRAPQYRARVRSIQKRLAGAQTRQVEFALSLIDQLNALSWDFDPDAQTTGEVFDNAEDLIASLNR